MATAAMFNPGPRPRKQALTRAMNRVSNLLQTKLPNALAVVDVTEKGADPRTIQHLIESGFPKNELVWVIPPRTLKHRMDKNERLNSQETERLIRAAKLYALAIEVMGGEEEARQWLRKPRPIFGGYSGLKLMQTESGASLVEETLCQIDAGYFA